MASNGYDERRERLFDQCKTLAQLGSVKPRKTYVRWINFHLTADNVVYTADFDSRGKADAMAFAYGPNRIACIRIQITEGEGL